MRKNRETVSLSKTSTEVLRGEADYSDWTDEELDAGRRRSKRGTWEGRSPVVIPMEMHYEMKRRRDSKGMYALQQKVEAACEYIAAVSAGEIEGDDVRLRHCIVLLNRTWGTAPVRIAVGEGKSEYERAGVMRAVVIRDRPGVIDAESSEADDVWWEDAEPEPGPPTTMNPTWEQPD